MFNEEWILKNWTTSSHSRPGAALGLGLKAIPLQECLPVELETQQLPGLLQMNNCELWINHGQWNPIEFWNIWGQQWRVHSDTKLFEGQIRSHSR